MYIVTVQWIWYLFTVTKKLGSGTYWLNFSIFFVVFLQKQAFCGHTSNFCLTCGSFPFLSGSGRAGHFNFTDTRRDLKNNVCAVSVITTYRGSNEASEASEAAVWAHPLQIHLSLYLVSSFEQHMTNFSSNTSENRTFRRL